MTPTQRAAALRLADDEFATSGEAAALLRELAAEPGQEPVAWHVCSVNSDGSLSLEYAAAWEEAAHEHINDAINEHDIEDAASWVVRPVYAAPQQRQPLTDEQISNRAWACYMDLSLQAEETRHKLLAFARAIEAMHGIKETP